MFAGGVGFISRAIAKGCVYRSIIFRLYLRYLRRISVVRFLFRYNLQLYMRKTDCFLGEKENFIIVIINIIIIISVIIVLKSLLNIF